MGLIDNAIKTLHYADAMSDRQNWLTQIHPLVKLLLSFIYLFMVVSVSKYDLGTLLKLCVFPILIVIYADIQVIIIVKRFWIILLLLCLPGIANLFYDQSEFDRGANFIITGGMISMLSLFLKGILGVITSFILLSSTSIEKICCALRMLHIPRKLVVVILLIHRYLILLLKETNRILLAYELRSDGKKGVVYTAWGTLAGLLFLRSADRAHLLYESMMLRGFSGDFYYDKIPFTAKDLFILISSIVFVAILRFSL